MTCLLYFPDETRSAEIIVSTFRFSELYHNALKPSDGSCSFSVVFTTELANALKTYIDYDVKVQIKNDDNVTNFYTGYLKKSVTFTKTQRNNPIALTVVSPSYFLDKTTDSLIGTTEKTVTYIIEYLLGLAGISGYDIGTIGISATLPFFALDSGSNIKETITELCYEYGKTFYFDRDGVFQTGDIFNQPQTYAKTFNGTNIRNSLSITAKEHEADFVRATYSGVKKFTSTLLFEDTQNATDDDKCQIEIAANSWFADTEDNMLDADSTEGDVLYVETCTPDISVDNGVDVTCNLTDREKVTQFHFKAYNNNSTAAYIRKLDVYGDAYIQTEERQEVTSTGTKEKEATLKYIYDQATAQTFAKNLADYYRYAKFTLTFDSQEECELGAFCIVTEDGTGTFYGRVLKKEYSLTSKSIRYTVETIADYEPSTIDQSSATHSAHSSASTTIPTGISIYSTLAPIPVYVDASGAVTQNQSHQGTIHILDGLDEKTVTVSAVNVPDGMEASINGATVTYAIAAGSTIASSGTIEHTISYTDTDGNTVEYTLYIAFAKMYNSQTVSSPYILLSTNKLTFRYDKSTGEAYQESAALNAALVYGNETLRGDSISVTTDVPGLAIALSQNADNSFTIIATSAAGLSMSTGNIYVSITHGWLYGDEDESTYVDEDDIEYIAGLVIYKATVAVNLEDGSQYLGLLSTVEEVEELTPLRGDYFVWAGEDATACTSVKSGLLYKSQIYKYVGVVSGRAYMWEIDTSVSHGATALTDLLSVYEDNLTEENSQVTQFVNRLAANAIFVERLVANTAFITSLFAESIKATGSLRVGERYNASGEIVESSATGAWLGSSGVLKAHNAILTSMTAENGTFNTGTFNGNINIAGIATAANLSLSGFGAGNVLLRYIGNYPTTANRSFNVYTKICGTGTVRVNWCFDPYVELGVTIPVKFCIYVNSELKHQIYEIPGTGMYMRDVSVSEGDVLRFYGEYSGAAATSISTRVRDLYLSTDGACGILAYLAPEVTSNEIPGGR